ncbi:MAG: hypothetical protein MZU97_26975 [Bacillus subtilis]|nr:hypothetical protein [Bacillus subtilis]
MLLRTEYRVCAEMADLENVVIIQTVADDEETMAALLNALTDVSHRFKADPEEALENGKAGRGDLACDAAQPGQDDDEGCGLQGQRLPCL